MTNPLRVIILGATSAIAEATARLYAQENACLLLAGRNADHLNQISVDLLARGATLAIVETLDLGETGIAAQALDRMIETLGGVDHVLLFYGILGDQARAETDEAHAAEILDVNFNSAAQWCLAAASRLEGQGRGSLVVIGSVAGDRGRQSNYVYGAAKAGLGVLVQGIAHRFAIRQPKGARAVVVKPGFVDTPMTAGMKKGGPLWAEPEAIAAIVRKAADKGGPIVYAPGFWRAILLVIRLVPASIFHKVRL
ncbi:MAG TPA: SDR family NAD(P)-dependent oxidoreductase [Roseiarcus sp.]|nr:SDR family NAD(P)-dependent oxidoreductase [Roseiarcus sp.]